MHERNHPPPAISDVHKWGGHRKKSSYVVQFYYRSTGATTVSNLQGGASPSGTGIPNYSPASNTYAGTSGAWVKFAIVETNQPGTGLGIGVVRFAGLSLTNIDVDDFVVYPGTAADNTPPDPITCSVGSVRIGRIGDVELDSSHPRRCGWWRLFSRAWRNGPSHGAQRQSGTLRH